MFGQEYEERCFTYTTDKEWDDEEARELGRLHPDRAWVVTDRDVVHPNPYYKGAPRCHPECECMGEGPREGCYTNPPRYELLPWAKEPVPPVNDDYDDNMFPF